jgi:hypothetical protein
MRKSRSMATYSVQGITEGMKILGWAVHCDSISDPEKIVSRFTSKPKAEADATKRRNANGRRTLVARRRRAPPLPASAD